MSIQDPANARRVSSRFMGIPRRSPYFHSQTTGPIEPVDEPVDATWFAKYGFRSTGISEEKHRDYGFGVPMWSPYYTSKAKHGEPTAGAGLGRQRPKTPSSPS